MIVALSWLLLIMLLVALGAWLYARFEQPSSLPESAAATGFSSGNPVATVNPLQG